MTHAIAPPHPASAPTGTVARIALVLVVAVLLATAFATGRATAPDDTVRTVATTPAAEDGAALPFDCPPSRPPVC